jgi:hypothetical protein
MAAVHPGALATGALQKEEEEEEVQIIFVPIVFPANHIISLLY